MTLFKSKKFWVAIGGAVITTILDQCGLPKETITGFIALISSLLLGMGMADFGKNAPK